MQDVASSSPVVGAAAAVSAPAASSSSSANVANSSSTNGAAGSPTELARKRSRSTSLTDQTAAPAPADKADNPAEGPSAASAASASSSSAQADTTATDNATPSDSNKDGKVSKKAHLDHQAPSYVSSKHLQQSQNGSDAAPDQPAATAQDGSAPPSAQITIRTLIVTQDASVIIGKGGKNVNEIREKSGSKVTITEAIQGNPERIMSVSGPLDAVAKAFGLIVRRINEEPFDVPSVPGSRAVTIRIIVPHSRMGSVIGKGGVKIKEIQEASGARLQASDQMLPASTERILSVSGVADAIHIAVYYIGTVLLEHPTLSSAHQQYRPMQPGFYPPPPPTSVADYSRLPAGGGGSGGAAPAGPAAVAAMRAAAAAAAAPPTVPTVMPGVTQTQQVFIPNDLVGAIIGKGGAKINEIRSHSQCQIKISDPVDASASGGHQERLVTITGVPQAIQTAINMLYSRLDQEKQKMSGSSNA